MIKRILNNKIVASSLVLATVLTVGVLANTKRGQVQSVEANAGCAFVVSASQPNQLNTHLVALIVQNGSGTAITTVAGQNLALDSSNLVTVVWDAPCLATQLPAASARCISCPFGPPPAGTVIPMWEGYCATTNIVTVDCGACNKSRPAYSNIGNDPNCNLQ